MGDGASVYGNWGFRDTYGRSDFLDIICDPDHEDEILIPLSDAIENLSSDQKIDYLNFEHINDRGFIKRKLLPYLEALENTESIIRESDVCPSINLKGSFDDYLMELSSSSRRKTP
ncbi:MAG: hypothetical protein U5K71_16430 [Gracilimonas sp.]|nr:hypothetical protein [Gracilimonas sp.]